MADGGTFPAGYAVGQWILLSYVGGGANGEVWKCEHKKNKMPAVMKLAKDKDRNNSMQIERTMLQHLKKAGDGKNENLVKMLDEAKVQHPKTKEECQFFVMEMVDKEINTVLDAPNDYTPEGEMRRRQMALKLGLQLLKGIHALHSEGLLHRDLKPENMGVVPGAVSGEFVLKIFDFGMCRMYSDEHGNLRAPRSWVGMRGTREWASWRSESGREQCRGDDLWAWFYCLIEWMNPGSTQPFPWTDRNAEDRQMLKSSLAPVRLLLRNCPLSFWKINMYLRLLPFTACPDYVMLGKCLQEGHEQLEIDDERSIPFRWPPKKEAE